MSILRRRANAKRLGAWPRGLSVIAVGTLGAAALSACGGPSAAQGAAQNITAGIAAQGAKQYASAAKYYEKALASQPKDATALYDLGDVEQLEGLDSAAKTHYLAALAIDPTFASAMYNLAILDAKSSPAEAEALYEQVLKMYPKDADVHFNLGYVLISLGQKSAGLAQINEGIKLDPALASRVSKGLTTSP